MSQTSILPINFAQILLNFIQSCSQRH